jgi:phage FluMu gp28-like protein
MRASAYRRLADTLRYANDPVAFARDKLDFEPDPWQVELLSSTNPNIICNCSRQVGKSTTTAAKAVHAALYDPGLILLISPSLRQTRELFNKVSEFIRRLQPVQELVEDNRLSCQLENGSRIVSLPGDAVTVRGFSAPRLIVEDEAAFVSDELHSALRPMLAVSQGQMILLSSPNGRRGHFFKLWSEGGPAWQRFSVSIYDCPRIGREWIEAEKAITPAHRWAAEFECQFSDTSDALFSHDLIQAAFSDEVAPLFSPTELVAMAGMA